ncbi:NAD-dependent epimerase/dehydratase family protein [Kaistella sp. DKR-2]|uniref:NAD-dependent epimerase/dehydratase family protein n=1 Tax=Kaistella soli TaxID=2849654 RepID=UPI001C25EF88|nr:NAD-dependent epimerase/dehydratase family protein [Kaistella soli]MBU8882788.1 NAD-dependent epimerase/dehydratase family protein [Kaistella soli]
MVLVTGATGILGRVIVLELMKRGKTVRATKRKSSDTEEVRNSYKFYTEKPDTFFDKIEWVNVDFDDIVSLQNALDGVEDVYHCAAKVGFHPGEQREMFHTNIEGTKNLLFACDGSSVKNFCFVSSIAVLDGFNEEGEIDENSDYNPKLDHSAYAVSKHFSEMEVWRASAEGLNTVIVNPGVIIGSGNWDASSGVIFDSFAKPYTFSGGTSYVDVRDVAKISVDLMENNIFDERFILVSGKKSYFEMGTSIRKKMGKPAPKIIAEPVLIFGRILNFLLGWIIKPLKMVNKTNVESITTMNSISNKKITEKLGFQFIPVSESIGFHFENYLSEQKK